MDRGYLKPHVVNVYAQHSDVVHKVPPVKQVKRVPYHKYGFNNYMVDNVCLKGYMDKDYIVDANVFMGDHCYNV